MSDDEPVSLSEARAHKTRNAKDWTPLDALRACMRDIKSGKIKPEMLFIAMREHDHDKDTSHYPSYAAGVNAFDVRGLLWSHLIKGEEE